VPNRRERMWRHIEEDKALRESRKQVKRNRKPKKVRNKDWVEYVDAGPDEYDMLDDAGFLEDERIMPRGERERRRRTRPVAAAPAAAQEESREAPPADRQSGRQGVVVEVSTGLCRVMLDDEVILCHLRGSLTAHESGFTNVVAVGDRVWVSQTEAERGVVEAVLTRQSALARSDVFRTHLQQVIVANVDQVLIVASWRNPHIWLELIDRYLIAAERNNLSPVICVNKIDLATDREEYLAELRPYLDLGYPVYFTSAESGEGLDALQTIIHGRTTVLAGMSGVGKSTLLSLAEPGLDLRTGIVSDTSGEGRHTTTQVSLLPLAGGGFVVDTPGIREFGLIGLRQSELSRFYPEIDARAGECQFSNCSHLGEPGCAVRVALESGTISPNRYHNFRVIYESLPA